MGLSSIMPITDRAIDQTFSELKGFRGGTRNDYFGVLYIMQEFGIDREVAMEQVAFGGNDYGIDGFHFDELKRNLYLFQFKWSTSYEQFKVSFKRLIEHGMERIFGTRTQDQHQDQLVQQIKSCILENEAIIDRVCIHFVFNGDPDEAERSQILDGLRENLENKKYLIDQRFDRPVTMAIEFRSARTRRVGSAAHLRKTHSGEVANWQDAADDAYTFLHERKREFSPRAMCAVIDDLAVHGSVTQAEMIDGHGKADFIATTLGHVTTAVHGKGVVPPGGWYSTTKNPHTYIMHPKFAEAWRKKRRL
jgi:hypothetical protein